MMNRIELTFDYLPDSGLSANGRRRMLHWVESKRVRNAKTDFTFLLRDAWQRTYPQTPLEARKMARCRLEWRLTYPTRRRRDIDNIASSLKPWQDCLVDEGLIEADDSEHIVGVAVTLGVEKGIERTVLAIEEVE